jgi:hypothetical protein
MGSGALRPHTTPAIEQLVGILYARNSIANLFTQI